MPAALVTLLLVHQPSIGDRRLYPMLRGSLALIGLGLALATLITWATASDRLSRSSLSGLAWAGVTTILCIGPFLESTPGARLYALDLETGDVVWDSRAGTAPRLVDGELVVDRRRGTGRRRPRTERRHGAGVSRSTTPPSRASAGDHRRPVGSSTEDAVTATADVEIDEGPGGLEGEEWPLTLPGEEVLDVAHVGNSVYVYVATPGAAGGTRRDDSQVDGESGEIRWPRSLSEVVAVGDERADIAANEDVVVVAGGEHIAVLDAADGRELWTASVVTLGKSRGYALPGADQRVEVSDSLVFLSTTPDS